MKDIRNARLEKGISLEELAKIIDIPPITLSEIENNAICRLSWRKAYMLSSALGLPVDLLLC